MRLLYSVAIGLTASFLQFLCRIEWRILDDAGDWWWPFCAARMVIDGGNPYGGACPIVADGVVYPPNMLPTALLAVPLLPLGRLAPSLLWGISSSMLAWGLLAQGKRWQLLAFALAPYWQCCWYMQWSPLILAIALTPALYPLLWCKPHIGLPVAVLRWRWWGVAACAGLLAISLIIMPSWPAEFIASTGSTYSGRPLIILAPWLLMAVRNWRDERAQWLLGYALVPTRGLYDLYPIWLTIKTRNEALILITSSWIGAALPEPWGSIGFITVALIIVRGKYGLQQSRGL
jgi:hypothetical protein